MKDFEVSRSAPVYLELSLIQVENRLEFSAVTEVNASLHCSFDVLFSDHHKMTFWPRETVYNDGRMHESRKSSTNFKFPQWSINSKPERRTYGGAAAVPLNVSQLPASMPTPTTNRVDFIKTVRVTSSAENQKHFDSILIQERIIHDSNDRGHISRCTSNSRLSRELCDEIQKTTAVSSLDCNADLPPGTGVYYTPSRSINSKGYGHVRSDMQGLSLLADVSCEVNCNNRRSRNMNLKRPGSTPAYKVSKNR